MGRDGKHKRSTSINRAFQGSGPNVKMHAKERTENCFFSFFFFPAGRYLHVVVNLLTDGAPICGVHPVDMSGQRLITPLR